MPRKRRDKVQMDGASVVDEPPPRPECDICMVPLPIKGCFVTYMTCCGKTLCCGCMHTNKLTITKTNKKRIEKAKKEHMPPPRLLEEVCPFCRMELPGNDERCDRQNLDRVQKRVEMEDPESVFVMAGYYKNGDYGLSPDEGKYLELLHQAASLGSANARFLLGDLYSPGVLSVYRGASIARAYFQAAAKSGHVLARHCFGKLEDDTGNKQTAVLHWRISAAAGHKPSVDELIKCFQKGLLSKESLEDSIRAKHEACQAIRSEGRDLALKKMTERGEVAGSYY